MKKKFNFKIIIGVIILLAFIGTGITLFLLNNNLGVVQNGNTSGNINNGGVATIYDGWIYYSNEFDKLYKMKNDGSNETVVESKEKTYDFNYLNVAGDWIYYTEYIHISNDKKDPSIYAISKIKTDGSQKTKLEETKQGCYDYITVEGDWIYYITHNVKEFKDYEIYKIKTDGSKKTKLTSSEGDKDYYFLSVVGDWIYYRESAENIGNSTICKIKTDGSQKTEVTTSSETYAYLSVVGDYMYYISNDRLYRMKTDGSEKTELTNSDVKFCSGFAVAGNWIYYAGSSDSIQNTSLYKMKTDGSKNTKISKKSKTDKSYHSDLNIVGDWLFYHSGNPLYKIKTDGTIESEIK